MNRLNDALTDRYRIERELGTGGWLPCTCPATSPSRCMVALKVMFVREANSRTYDVAPDGRFVMLRGRPTTQGTPVLVQNWIADVRRKLKR